MEAVAHEAFLDSHIRDAKGKSTGTNREHFEVAARKGSARAIKALEHGPQVPESLSYLYQWARDLHGKSGVGMSGYNPLTYTTVADWARLTRNDPEPHEVETLFWLDAIMLNPPKDVS